MKKYIFLVVIVAALFPLSAGAQTLNVSGMSGAASQGANRKELMIPNAFSPNNDGRNDFFKVCNMTDEKLIDFKVFNRWGTILFRTTDPRQGWDGTYKGELQSLGVYGYMIRIGYPDGNVETYKGTVTLLR